MFGMGRGPSECVFLSAQRNCPLSGPALLCAVWLAVFLLVQMVVDGPVIINLVTQGARFLLPLGSAGRLLPGLSLSQRVQRETPFP